MGTFTAQELIDYLEMCDPEQEIKIRLESRDFTILDILQDWRGATYLFALEDGK